MGTHEIVHISDDLKHDAYLVKVFTNRAEQILENSGIVIHKIIEFTDQAPSQYKNKTAFHYLQERRFPIVKNFFSVRHGKSSCDLYWEGKARCHQISESWPRSSK